MLPAEPTLPLALVGEGTTVRLVGSTGGQRGAHRLAELGLTPGVALTVLRESDGTLIIAVGDTRLALGAGVAHTLLVALIDRSNPHA